MASDSERTIRQWQTQTNPATNVSDKTKTPGGGPTKPTGPVTTVYDKKTPYPTPKPTTTTPKPATTTNTTPTQVVPGETKGAGQINIGDYAGQIVTDPSVGLSQDNPNTATNESGFLQDHLQQIDPNTPGTNINGNDKKYQMDADGVQGSVTKAKTEQTTQMKPQEAAGYTAKTTQGNIEQNGQMEAQQGTLSDGSIIKDVPQIDVNAHATGQSAVGKALDDAAQQDLNTVDPKATVQGQIEQISQQFVGPDGEPRIPPWAAATARSVGKIAAFSGMTGTAANAAMASALLEASLPMAYQDAQFFQTLTVQNLNNRQQTAINKANVLARFEEANLDARMTAAVENSKAFLAMDMKNLDNRQQAEIINTQARVQSILEDAKAVNTQRLFNAESKNDMTKFYDQLNSNIKMFNTAQANQMNQFNAGEANSMTKFNKEMEDSREKFYKEMQYNIDLANAKWRQTVTLTENAQAFEAAATDVKNMLGLSVEQMNQLWDRSDALLDYLWKSSENEKDRKASLTLAKMKGEMDAKAADKAGWGNIFGSVLGNIAGSDKFLDWIF